MYLHQAIQKFDFEKLLSSFEHCNFRHIFGILQNEYYAVKSTTIYKNEVNKKDFRNLLIQYENNINALTLFLKYDNYKPEEVSEELLNRFKEIKEKHSSFLSNKILQVIGITKEVSYDSQGSFLEKNQYKNLEFEDLRFGFYDQRVVFKNNNANFEKIKIGSLFRGEIIELCGFKIVKFEEEELSFAILDQGYKYNPKYPENFLFNRWKNHFENDFKIKTSKDWWNLGLDLAEHINSLSNEITVSEEQINAVQETLQSIGIDLSKEFVSESFLNTSEEILDKERNDKRLGLDDLDQLRIALMHGVNPFVRPEIGKRDFSMVTRIQKLAKSEIKFKEALFIENLMKDKFPDYIEMLLEAIRE